MLSASTKAILFYAMPQAARQLGPQRLGVEIVENSPDLGAYPGLGIALDEALAVAHSPVPHQRGGVVEQNDVDLRDAQRPSRISGEIQSQTQSVVRAEPRLVPDPDVDIGKRAGGAPCLGADQHRRGHAFAVQGLGQPPAHRRVQGRHPGLLIDDGHGDIVADPADRRAKLARSALSRGLVET